MDTASVSVELRNATESSVTVSLVGVNAETATPLESELHGPVCAYARTLPSVVGARAAAGDTAIEFLMTEPCYWTPQLPFLYDLHMRVRDSRGTIRELDRSLGLRRLVAHGRNLRLGGERIVLRGASCEQLEASRLVESRAAGTAIVTRYPNDELYDAAAHMGVFLVADTTVNLGNLVSVFRDLSWQPAVALVLLDRDQIVEEHALVSRRMNLLLAQRIRTGETAGISDIAAAADVIAVELAEGERPPEWVPRLVKPVIAIRRGRAYADFHEARAACDRLQAELAPEFDLAGYFV